MSRQLQYPEKRIERKLYEAVALLGGECIKNVPLGHKNLPDRNIYLPGGFFCMVEVKRPGEQPNNKQALRIKRFRDLGFFVFVVDSPESVSALIEYFKQQINIALL